MYRGQNWKAANFRGTELLSQYANPLGQFLAAVFLLREDDDDDEEEVQDLLEEVVEA